MYCAYPLDNDVFTLEINLTKHLKISTLFSSIKTVLSDVNVFWNYKKASINTLVVSHNNNISLSYFANVKHTWNSMKTVVLD